MTSFGVSRTCRCRRPFRIRFSMLPTRCAGRPAGRGDPRASRVGRHPSLAAGRARRRRASAQGQSAGVARTGAAARGGAHRGGRPGLSRRQIHRSGVEDRDCIAGVRRSGRGLGTRGARRGAPGEPIERGLACIYVETPVLQGLPDARREAILAALHLARNLGAATAVISSPEVPRASPPMRASTISPNSSSAAIPTSLWPCNVPAARGSRCWRPTSI